MSLTKEQKQELIGKYGRSDVERYRSLVGELGLRR